MRRATQDNELYTNFILKPTVKEQEHYYFFNKKIYTFLEERYGAKQVIKRHVIEDEERKDQLFLDVHLKVIRILMPFFNGLADWKTKFVISISRKESVSAVEERLKHAIQITQKP